MATFCLTLHADYACGHSGECCRTWSVAAESRVMLLVGARGIAHNEPESAPFVRTGRSDGDGSWNIARDASGACVFFDRGRGRLCAIHAAAGEQALPTACRHFPRVMLRDGRGTFISLSHYCPTAAGLLLEQDLPRIVPASGRLTLQEPIEGLEARTALPPLVRPGLLADLEGYGAWEQSCIDAFARPEGGWEEALDRVAAATERIRTWQPGTRSLQSCVEEAFRGARHEDGADPHAHARAIARVRTLAEGAADDLAPVEPTSAAWRRLTAAEPDLWNRAMRNYLAARAFGNWIAYQGRGLRSIVEWLRTCAAVACSYARGRVANEANVLMRADVVESFRRADLLLLHTIDSQAFARHVSAREGPDPR